VISGVPSTITPNGKTSVAAAASIGGRSRAFLDISSDEESESDSDLYAGGLDLKKSGRMTPAKRQRLLNNEDVKRSLTFTPFHFFGVFEEHDTSIVQVVVIHLPSGVDSSTFKPSINGNLLQLEMQVPPLMSRGDLLFSHMKGTRQGSFMTRLVNFKSFVAKCLGQKKPGDEVMAHSKIYLPAPALDNKFTCYDETVSDDGATVVTIEMMVEEAYIEGKVVAKKKTVKL